jgi:hypothetical protein
VGHFLTYFNDVLQGEEILSQTNVTQDGGDSDGETLPDDDDLSDVVMFYI